MEYKLELAKKIGFVDDIALMAKKMQLADIILDNEATAIIQR